jgi:hypothetical protein
MGTVGVRSAAAVAALALIAGARPARADVAVAGDFDIGIPVDQAPARYLATGAGFDLRLGYRFIVPYQHISIVPELAAGYTDLSAGLVRIRPGLRVGIGRVLTPYVCGHVGWAFAAFDPLGSGDTSAHPSRVSASGASFDVGGGLEVTVLPHLSVGAHVGYNQVEVAGTARAPAFPARWLNLGLSATAYF